MRDIKEDVCFVSQDYEADMAKSKESTELTEDFELPDGQVIKINMPRFKAPEGIFKPDLIQEGSESEGMHLLANKSLKECDIDIRSDLMANVILSGGSTMYKGLPDRLQKELDVLAPKRDMVKIIASGDRYYSVWTGGSTLVSLSTFESQWITKEEYEENGAEIVHRKCV